jgi:hypothetical protein
MLINPFRPDSINITTFIEEEAMNGNHVLFLFELPADTSIHE